MKTRIIASALWAMLLGAFIAAQLGCQAITVKPDGTTQAVCLSLFDKSMSVSNGVARIDAVDGNSTVSTVAGAVAGFATGKVW